MGREEIGGALPAEARAWVEGAVGPGSRVVRAEPLTFTGAARQQVADFVAQVARVAERFPEAAGYRSAGIL